MSNDDKISFILKHEAIITNAIINGHSASCDDEFSEIRNLLDRYRRELGFNLKKEKNDFKTIIYKKNNSKTCQSYTEESKVQN